MDKNNHGRPKRQLNAVDGMLPSQGHPHKLGSVHPRREQGNTSQLGGASLSRNRLDNFSAADGFHPAIQPRITAPGEHPEQHKRLDDQPKNQPKTHATIDLSLDDGAKKPKKNIFQVIKGWPRRKYLAIPLAIILIFGFVFLKGIWKLNQVFQGGGGAAALEEGVDPSRLRGEGDGRINILLLGKGGEGHTAPDLTDTLLIASIDPVNKQAALLSIPRDLWVQPEGSGYTKINSVYANAKYAAQNQGQDAENAEKAGLAAIEKIVSDKMGIPIHYHAMMDFKAFMQAVETVGGVTIDVPEELTVYEYYGDSGYVLDVKAGSQSFDGPRALAFARTRQTSPRGDFDRTERQRLMILGLKDKVLSAGTLSNPAKISGLIDSFGNHIRINMTLEEVLRLYEIGAGIEGSSVASLSLAARENPLVTTANINGISVVVPRAGPDDYSAIQNYVRNALRDGFLASEDAKVLVLNGTQTAGLATKKSEELKSYGYNVLESGTAPTQAYAKTVLVDLTNGQKKYSKHYLEQRLGVTATTSLPDSNIDATGADFVIILGADASSSQN